MSAPRAIVAMLAVAACACWSVPTSVHAQNASSSSQQLGIPTFEGVKPDVKTSQQGKNTVTTETWVKNDHEPQERATVTTVTDENGNTISRTGTEIDTSHDGKIVWEAHITDTFNALGGYERVTSVTSRATQSPSETENHETFDGANHLLSQDLTITWPGDEHRKKRVVKSHLSRAYNADGSYTETSSGDVIIDDQPSIHNDSTSTYDAQDHQQTGERKETTLQGTDAPKTKTYRYDKKSDSYGEGLPLNSNPNLVPVPDQPGYTPGTGGVSLPPSAGAESEIVLNVDGDSPDSQAGAGGVLMLTVDQNGDQKTYRAQPKDGRLTFAAALSGAALATIEVLKGFDKDGKPIVGSRLDIGDPAHLADTEPVANVPQSGPAIREAARSIEPGDTLTLHIQGNDPQTTRFLLDGQPMKTLAVSNNSALVRFDSATTLGHHEFVMQTGSQKTSPLMVTVVKLTPHPIPPARPGVTVTARIEVAGLVPGDAATMSFALAGDAAQIVGGGTTRTVPVTDGVAELPLIGRHAGQILLRFHLNVQNAQFAT